MRILLTGGQTAGHAWPVILIADYITKNTNSEVLYVGARQGIERGLLKNYSFPYKLIIVGKKRAYFSIENFSDVIKIIIGIVQGLWIILTFKPEVVFAKGGFVTLPILFWLKFLK